MKKNLIRIATRRSALALWQASHIKLRLEQCYPDLRVELLPMVTSGDQQKTGPLQAIGGKRLFVKELEQSLLDNQADIAVHSMKDVPMDFPAGLSLAVICKRADPRDVLVANQATSLATLPAGSVIGTSSLRRTCQLRALRPDLIVQPLRGNVDTRVRLLEERKFDAIVLAAAGMMRLALTERITEYLAPDICLPAVGQGALGIECRSGDQTVLDLVQALNHLPTFQCVSAERAMNEQLQGGCQVPVAAYATLEAEQLTMHGLVGKPDGTLLLRAMVQGDAQAAVALGQQLAADLLNQGAAEILQNL